MLGRYLGEGGQANICSDSSSALQSVVSGGRQHVLAQRAFCRLLQLRASGREISLFWVKAHQGHAGNERADALAKEATLLADITAHPLPISSVRQRIRVAERTKWQAEWSSATTGRPVFTFLPTVKNSWPFLNGKLVQLISGHGPFRTYLARHHLREGDGSCPCRGGMDSPRHILQDCTLPERVAARDRLASILAIKGVSWPCDPPALCRDHGQLITHFANAAVFDYPSDTDTDSSG